MRLLREALFICGIAAVNIWRDPQRSLIRNVVQDIESIAKCIKQWLELVDNPNVGTLKKIQDKKALLDFGVTKNVNVRTELGMSDKPKISRSIFRSIALHFGNASNVMLVELPRNLRLKISQWTM